MLAGRFMKLRDYIEKEGISLRDFADRIAVGYYTLQRYLAGTRYPTPTVYKAIFAATKGKVQPNDFYDLKA